MDDKPKLRVIQGGRRNFGLRAGPPVKTAATTEKFDVISAVALGSFIGAIIGICLLLHLTAHP